MPLCVVVVDTSFKFVENAYLIQESSVDPGGLPSRYIIKSMITIGFSLLFLQALSTIAKSILTIAGRSEPLNS
jgi:TRAP-type mannitol/chloroaromatic compound transport system permease small subunit